MIHIASDDPSWPWLSSRSACKYYITTAKNHRLINSCLIVDFHISYIEDRLLYK